MKKTIKILMPILGLSALTTTMLPLLSSCTEKEKVIPSSFLDIDQGVIKGFIPEIKEKGLGSYNILDFTILENNDETTYTVDESAFWNCSSAYGFGIKKIIFSTKIKEIGKDAFSGCKDVEVIDFSRFKVEDYENNLFGTMCFDRWNTNAQGTILFNEDIDQNFKDSIITDLYAYGKLTYKWYTVDFIENQTTGICAEIMQSDEWERISSVYRSISVDNEQEGIKLFLNAIDEEKIKLIIIEDLIEYHIKQKIQDKSLYPYDEFFIKVISDTIKVERDEFNIPWGLSGKVITRTKLKFNPTYYDIVVEYDKMPIHFQPNIKDKSRICVLFDHTSTKGTVKVTCEQLIQEPGDNPHTVVLATEADESKGIKSFNEYKAQLKEKYPDDPMGYYLVENIWELVSIKSAFLRNVRVISWEK